ncbi:hypothetical protein, partial [Bacillus pumilus]|uniref:hypothetical protein n=1 Tax=Bacillus pumilus TaxID=1408 RepID=UPI001C92C7BC
IERMWQRGSLICLMKREEFMMSVREKGVGGLSLGEKLWEKAGCVGGLREFGGKSMDWKGVGEGIVY